MNKIKLFNKSSTGKIKVLEYELKGNKVISRWGYIDNEKNWQETIDEIKIGKNLGKTTEQSPEDCARFQFERKIRLKKEEGYSETLTETNSSSIDWKNGILPNSFAPPKPATSIEQEDEENLARNKCCVYERKHNGQRHFIVRAKKCVRIYSRRLEDRTDRFPEQVKKFEKILRPGSIIDTECVLNDNPDLIKEVCGSDSEKAIERQNTTHGLANFVVFDWLYLNYEPYLEKYRNRLQLIENTFDTKWIIRPVEILGYPTKPSEIPAIPKGYEGLVLWNLDSIGTKEIRFDGKPSRKAGCFKIKKTNSVDLVCYEWMTGKGKLNDSVATLKLGAYDDDGKLVPICESGSGLTDSVRDEILKLSPMNKFKLFTVEIKYEEKIEKSGSLRLPIFLRIRNDKSPKECLVRDIK